MFAPVYICPNCGDVWEVSIVEEIDFIHDDIYTVAVCNKCNSTDLREKIVDGIPEWHPLTKEEIDRELYWDEDPEDYY